jgi:hypothetical protein
MPHLPAPDRRASITRSGSSDFVNRIRANVGHIFAGRTQTHFSATIGGQS